MSDNFILVSPFTLIGCEDKYSWIDRRRLFLWDHRRLKNKSSRILECGILGGWERKGKERAPHAGIFLLIAQVPQHTIWCKQLGFDDSSVDGHYHSTDIRTHNREVSNPLGKI